MKLKDYLGDKAIIILMYIFLMVLILFFLVMFKVPIALITSIAIVLFIFGAMMIVYDYLSKRAFYNEFQMRLEGLDKKYLITEMVNKPNFLEGRLLCEFLYEIDKSMNEDIEEYRRSIRDFKEYIELWIHEVKLPIASCVLILHNNKADANKKVGEQLQRIENYVEQVLYFARGENSEKDYLIKGCNLKDIINTVIKKNKDTLILKNIRIQIENIEVQVLSDSKWLEFIINQVLSNSIKYCSDKDPSISFKVVVEGTQSTLYIEDNGIGISEKDISKVFEKSFTGENGRQVSTSTGMGLYLAQKLCKKLGHSIDIASVKEQFTRVSIIFNNNEYYEVLN